MSGDPEQEYFSDGITEDIITALSKVSSLMVVARTSTFTYKDRAIDIKQVGREQGVRYVVEGSVRRAGDRVRVTAQLIDAVTGHHIWAERYDRELHDIFAVQDELVREIVTALDVELREGEQHRMWSSGTDNLEAWECVQLGQPIVSGSVPGDGERAKKLFERASELDPNYAMAWVMLGWYHFTFADVGGWRGDAEQRKLARAPMRKFARKAIEVDPYCADAYCLMAMYHLEQKEFDEAIENAEKSIVLAPSNAEVVNEAATLMTKAGEPNRGVELARRSMRLCPRYRAGYLRVLGVALRFADEPEKALPLLIESVKRERTDHLSPRVNLASLLGELGRVSEAENAAKDVLRLASDFSIKAYVEGLSYRSPGDLRRIAEGLQRAGLPE